MNSFLSIDRTLILFFLGLFLILYIISNHSQNKEIINKTTVPQVRYSYGDEFYNYRGGSDNIESRIIELTNEEDIIEGFSLEKIKETHLKCPVLNGATTRITSCIHYPNRYMKGLGEKIDKGFLVSTYTKREMDIIQRSLRTDDRVYDIIYKNGEYLLTNNRNDKQVLMECNPSNYKTITSLVGTFS